MSTPTPDSQPHEPAQTTTAKQELRALNRARRSRLSTQQRAMRDAKIQQHLLELLEDLSPGATVAAYCPSRTEPGGANMPDVLRDAGMKVLLPRVIQNSTIPAMEWVYYSGVLQEGPWGLSEPSGIAEPDPIDDYVSLFIVPALGVDSQGHRLGQGGGFYDRQFAQKQQCVPKCAIVDSEEIHPTIPHAQHDLTVDFIISERGQRRLKE